MRFLIAFLVIQFSIASAYVLNSVEGVNNHVEALNFDLNGNIYVATTNISNRFLQKLSPSMELLWTIELPPYDDFTTKIIINSRGDIYLQLWYDDRFTLAVLRPNTTTIEVIDERTDYLLVMDTDENLIYCKASQCYVLRPNSTVPIPIANIDRFYSDLPAETVIDSEGNVYFIGTFADDSKTAIVLLTKQALQEEVPYATVFRNAADPLTQFARNFFVDENNDFWIFLMSYENNQATVKKLENNSIETILVDKELPDIEGLQAKNRLYVAVYDYFHESVPTIFYITLENDIIDIPELKNLTLQEGFDIRLLADEDGYAYFQTNRELTPELGSMVVIKPNETKPIPIGFNDTHATVDRMFLDYKNDVWIFDVSGGMHFLKKGEVIVEKISNFSHTCTTISSNLVTKEVFFSCFSGLYVALESD